MPYRINPITGVLDLVGDAQGAPGQTFALLGSWSAGTSYAVADAVSHNGSSYACIVSHSNQEPPNATYWMQIAAKGNPGPPGSPGADGAPGQTFSLLGPWNAG
ncbi:MAG: hypothetical protein HQL85_07915, partial [Magnetococcales bacterium]|nr:hypothetical protein [Magnetococcales bacterium]